MAKYGNPARQASRRPSNMVHQFSKAPGASIPRSTFNRSHAYKTTFNAGKLIPFYVDEALPGDTFNLRVQALARLNTPITPLMDNLWLDVHFFAVPYRLVWDNWKKFCGEQTNPGDSTDFTVPTLTEVGGFPLNSPGDYMGVPIGIPNTTINVLHHRAYNLVYNEWYRPQDIETSRPLSTDDGPDSGADYDLLTSAKRHDYFTSALPWPQKGDSPPLPIGTTAPVLGIGFSDDAQSGPLAGTTQAESDGNERAYAAAIGATLQGTTFDYVYMEADQVSANPFPTIHADLSAATGNSINQLRQSFQIQKMLERDARSGTRYTEVIQAHFGVHHPDLSWRPEYLGGGTVPISVTPVAQTQRTDAGELPLGTLAGVGTASFSGIGFTKSFTEHNLLIGIIRARADLTYQQGLNRMFSRQTRYDYYWPALSHLGEQEIKNKEIYLQGTADDENVFGYQERWAEYRYKPSLVTGALRSAAPAPLDSWHLAQDFDSLPTLGTTFIREDVPIDRVVAVPLEPDFKLDAFFNVRCARPMPLYSIPGLIDHF